MSNDSQNAPVNSPVLRVSNLRLNYRTRTSLVEAVRGVSFDINKGERVALVGESGSGKSTIASSIIGLGADSIDVAAGSITFGTERTELLGAPARRLRVFRGRRIGYVPQDPGISLNPVLKVGEQVAEALRVHGLAGRKEAASLSVDALQAAGLDHPAMRAKQFPHELSGGMRQRVLIAIAVVASPSLLIADEPTSALDVTVQRRILDHLDSLTSARSLSTLFITHDLAVAAERSDRILVLSGGRIVESGTPAEILGQPSHPYTKRLVADAPSLSSRRRVDHVTFDDRQTEALATTPPALELSRIYKRFPAPSATGSDASGILALSDVSLSIPRRSTYGLVGESGSGKTTLGRIALRLDEPSGGRVRIGGTDVTELGGRSLRELRKRIQVVQQNPYDSLNPRMGIGQIIAEPLVSQRIGTRASRRRRVVDLLDQVALPASIAERSPAELSGGQRQRVAIARALAVEPEIVVLDEPVSALDVSVQAQILDLLVDLQSEHELSYLLISHDLAVVRDIAHKVGVIRRGELLEEADTNSVFAEPQHTYTRELLGAIPTTQNHFTSVTAHGDELSPTRT